MSLPKIDVPFYTLKLPSSGKEIKYRPFLVKEEKIALLAAQSNDADEIKNAIKQIITNCVLEPNFNVDELPVFDVEYILINLRIQSLGNNLEIEYTCNNTLTNEHGVGLNTQNVCGEKFSVNIKLDEVETIKSADYNKKDMKISDKLGVTLKYPTFKIVDDMDATENFDFNILKNVIEAVYDEVTVYPFKDYSDEEINDFLEGLNKDQYEMIEKWLQGLPHFEVNRKHVCANCGFEHEIKVNDLANFF